MEGLTLMAGILGGLELKFVVVWCVGIGGA